MRGCVVLPFMLTPGPGSGSGVLSRIIVICCIRVINMPQVVSRLLDQIAKSGTGIPDAHVHGRNLHCTRPMPSIAHIYIYIARGADGLNHVLVFPVPTAWPWHMA